MPESFPFSAEQYLLVGRVSKAHGLKGEMKVNPLPDQAEQIIKCSRAALVAVDGRMTAPLAMVSARKQGRQIILKLDTIDTKSEADLTVGMGVLIPRQDLPDDADETQVVRLLGAEVKLERDGSVIGTVVDHFHNGAHPILVVQGEGVEHLIPVVDGIVCACSEKEVLVDPPPGLLELSSGSPDEEKGD